MADLLELTRDIVCAHLRLTPLASDELLREIQQLHAAFHELDIGSHHDLHPSPVGYRSISSRHRKPAAIRLQHRISGALTLFRKRRREERLELEACMDLEANLAKARAVRQAQSFVTRLAPLSLVRRREPGPRDDHRPRK